MLIPTTMGLADSTLPEPTDPWLARFHAGDRDALEACYREHFRAVDAAVGRVLDGADRETVVHEIFYRLLSSAEMRAAFHGGAMGAWLARVSYNQAIDFVRRRRREVPLDDAALARLETDAHSRALERKAEASILIERFQAEHLPAKWRAVFRARFLEQLDQRTAAARLGMHRTTLAYQELRIRARRKRFLRKDAP